MGAVQLCVCLALLADGSGVLLCLSPVSAFLYRQVHTQIKWRERCAAPWVPSRSLGSGPHEASLLTSLLLPHPIMWKQNVLKG